MSDSEIIDESPPVKRVQATDAQKKMLDASMRDLMGGYPFLASMASSDSLYYHAVDVPPDDEGATAAFTDASAIYLNTAKGGWFDTTRYPTEDERLFIHAHEVLHVVREDPYWTAIYAMAGEVPVPRTPAHPDGRLPFDARFMDIALDCIVNSALIADRLGKMPKGGHLHPAITPMTTTQEAYAIVYDDNRGNGGRNNRTQGNGAGMVGDCKAPGSMGDPQGDDSPESSQPQNPGQALRDHESRAGERAVMVSRAVSAAREAGMGSTHAEAMVLAARAPGVDWRSYMQGFLARVAGNSSYDWRKPSRPPLARELSGEQPYFEPARGGNGMRHLMEVGDVSGSISEDEHRVILAALCESARDLRPKTMTVVWCDSEVLRIDVFDGAPDESALEDFYSRNPIPRGGGTSFIPPFEMCESLKVGGLQHVPADTPQDMVATLVEAGAPEGLVYVTDLHGPAPDEKPDFPVLWLATTSKEHPWGERVTLDPQELLE
jgi:hypothetical protein